MMKILTYQIILFLLFGIVLKVYSQKLPDNLLFDTINHQLQLVGSESEGFYNESTLEEIHLNFYDVNYWYKLTNNYNTDNYIPAKLSYKNIVIDSVGVQFKGQTSYSKAIKTGTKRLSFSIKLNYYIKGADIDGYNNLNLNNAYEDPSLLKEVVYGHLARKHIPAIKANFVKLYLNDEYWGVYPNIQQINGDFLKEWFLNNDGILWRADSESSNMKSSQLEGPGNGGGKWG